MLTNRGLLLLGGAASLVTIIAVTTALVVGLAGNDSPVIDVNFRRSSSSTTVFTTLAEAPSSAPSISMIPSAAPSHVPSLSPTSVPSSRPTMLPSQVPSSEPTLNPSLAPSISRMPSQYPSSAPSISQMPTYDDVDTKFRLKMYWQKDYFWQEEETERKWCATCCECNDINFSETSREDYNCRDSKGCNSGNQLYVRNCNSGHGADFLLENYPDGYLLRVDNTENCIERTQNSYLTLQRCDPTSERQKFQKFSQIEEFELRPVYDATEMCVSQHHHPKDYEVLGLDECERTRGYHVGKWVLYESD